MYVCMYVCIVCMYCLTIHDMFLSILKFMAKGKHSTSWTFFTPFLNPGWFSFFGNFFFPSPPMPASAPMPAQVSPTSLPTFRLLPTHLGLLPPPPTTHPSTYLPINLCTYALNLHQGNDNVGWWRYCNKPGRLLRSPSYLSNFMIVEKNVAMTQSKVLQLN